MKIYKTHWLFFKQSIILTIVALFLMVVSISANVGVLGVIVSIRALFMWISQLKDAKKYKVIRYKNNFIISQNDNKFNITQDCVLYTEEIVSKLNNITLIIVIKTGNKNSVLKFKNLNYFSCCEN